ncbi:DUF4167 domain-containing protein [Roseinatronobacter sp. NSM]|uniref:DUF4167 domain-containing protein n=1 Tax=Roseinatronobacter sp. NSM TaxID=3457785 RepID=UPI004035BEB1
MRSTKQRSRSKSNRPKSLGNIVNRVFDSSGPEGKVRGTPQQIIEKYQVLARDAQLSNDRVAAENFQQHAEHYTRMLAQAQREMQAEAEARRQQQEDRNRHQNDDRNRHQRRSGDDRAEQGETTQQQHGHSAQADSGTAAAVSPRSDSFSVQDQGDVDDSTLVETPEAKHIAAPVKPDTRPAPAEPPVSHTADAAPQNAENDAPKKPVRRKRTPKPAPAPEAAAPASAEDAPKPRRNTRKPRKPDAQKDTDTQPELPQMKPNAAE